MLRATFSGSSGDVQGQTVPHFRSMAGFSRKVARSMHEYSANGTKVRKVNGTLRNYEPGRRPEFLWCPMRKSESLRPDQFNGPSLLPAKRLPLVLQCICAAGVVVASSASAQGYPAHPVKIVVPFAAGGVADITARVLSQKIGEPIGQQTIVTTRPTPAEILPSYPLAKA